VAESRFKSPAVVLALGRVAENCALDRLQKNHHPPYIRRGPEGFCRFFGGVGKDFEIFFRFSWQDGGDLTIKFLVVRKEFSRRAIPVFIWRFLRDYEFQSRETHEEANHFASSLGFVDR
jgi:hypothetical protein